MAITKDRKVEITNDLVAKFKQAQSIGFATTNTMTVEEFANLRKNLREVSATYTIAKKTLIARALKEAINIEVDLNDLPWQIWVVCSNEDAIAGLSKTNAFMKEANGPKGDLWKIMWALSIIDWEIKDLDQTKVLASMPSRETLLGRLVGSMQSPISKLARFFDAAAKEVERQGKDSVGKLEKDAPTVEVEAPKEEVKVEEVVTETPAETKSEEVAVDIVATEEVKTDEANTPEVETPKEEEKAEEVVVETPAETKSEWTEAETTEEDKVEEAPQEEKKEEKAE